jgi:hypothetical protein
MPFLTLGTVLFEISGLAQLKKNIDRKAATKTDKMPIFFISNIP